MPPKVSKTLKSKQSKQSKSKDGKKKQKNNGEQSMENSKEQTSAQTRDDTFETRASERLKKSERQKKSDRQKKSERQRKESKEKDKLNGKTHEKKIPTSKRRSKPGTDVSKEEKNSTDKKTNTLAQIGGLQLNCTPTPNNSKENPKVAVEEVFNESPSDKEKDKEKLKKRGFDNRDKPVTDKQKQALIVFAEKIMTLGPKGVCEEFNETLKAYKPPTYSKDAHDKNVEKNRYDDIVCMDAHRVVLKGNGGDYIHANHVTGDPLTNSFICTQGPIPETVSDFWRMVIQEKVGTIMMLCRTIEMGKEKCAQYWPKDEKEIMNVGDFSIKNIGIDDKSDKHTCVTRLEITQGGLVVFTLKHLQWKCWPDQSVPQSHMAPFRLLRKARFDSRPSIVHCSAGIGRTGTLVAIELGLQFLLSGNADINQIDMLKKLRSMRGQSIQTAAQYLYMAACLLVFAETHLFDDEFYKKNPDKKQKYKAFLDEYEVHIKKESEKNDKREKRHARKMASATKDAVCGLDPSGKAKLSSFGTASGSITPTSSVSPSCNIATNKTQSTSPFLEVVATTPTSQAPNPVLSSLMSTPTAIPLAVVCPSTTQK